MWISKKEWIEKLDEVIKLRRDIGQLNSFKEMMDSVKESLRNSRNIYYVGEDCLLIDSEYYYNLIRQINYKSIENDKLFKDAEIYKKLYLDEFQKRLELADRVRELEGE